MPVVDPRAAGMTEEDLEDAVRRLVADYGALGWPVQAFHPWKLHARRAAAGYPDWTFAGPGGVMWRELKTMAGRPTAEQKQWLEVLRQAGADAAVWRPADLLDGTVAGELAVIAALPRAALVRFNREAMRGIQ